MQSDGLRLSGGAFENAVLMSSNDNGRLRWADRTRVSSTLWTVNGTNLYNNSNTNYAFNENSYDNVSKLKIKSDDSSHNLRFRNDGRLELINTNNKSITLQKDLISSIDSLTLDAEIILQLGNNPDTTKNVYILNNNALGDNTLGVISIGQTKAQEKLTVNGRMNTKTIKLDNGSIIGKKQFGTATMGVGNTGSLIKSINLNFPTPFSSSPKVYATVKNTGNLTDQFSVTTSNISSTGCTITVFRVDITSVGASDPGWGQNLLVDWIATK
jgi:hypothetical protein